jgi:hypothetical protein
MADFVAVIRRTVDGLSENVPEMRAKVYDKARGAVRRQLESMKPRPSDEMIERQMVKLEAAISEVEGDHVEALPPLEDEQVDSAPDVVEAEVPSAPVYEEEAPAAQAVEDTQPQHAPEAEDTQPVPAEPVERYEEPEAVAPVEADAPAVVEEHAYHEPEPVDQPVAEQPVEVAHSFEDHEHVAPIYSTEPVEYQPEPHPEPEPYQEQAPQHELEPEPVAAVVYEPPAVAEVEAEPESAADTPSVAEAEIEPVEVKPAQPAPSEWELPEWNDPVPATAHSEQVWSEPAAPVAVTDEIPDLTDYEPVETVKPLHETAESKDKPAAGNAQAWAWDDSDPFAETTAMAAAETSEPAISDWSWPVEKTSAAEPAQQKTVNDGWNEIDELLAHGSVAAGAAASTAQAGRSSAASPLDDEMDVPSRPVSYRVEPKRSRFNAKAVGLSAVLLLILGGGGYAYWQNQTAVNAWVSGMLSSVTAKAPDQPTPEASTPAEGTKDQPAPETNNQTQTPANTDVASAEGSSKFTQRLQQDGTEIDPGPAAAPAGANAAEEGKSVAAQTEAGKPVDTAQATATTPAGQAATDAKPAQPVPGQQTATNPATQQVPAGAQKMFLYEERLGQSAPTAIEGNVAWSVKEESPGGDAKPEPVIQAQINVPERGLTALMTIKRNADSSLPASHVIEFVFSLPENFEGGSIDSVQRVSMKRNEQDRGDALIAVPAKITEDFHMIALNDFPEAVATNAELLRTRGWIDIPLTYRNGRRALLTLEKGPAGTEAFTKALQAWSLAAKPDPAGQ